MKLEQEPRIEAGPNFMFSLKDILRKIALIVNGQDSDIAALKAAGTSGLFASTGDFKHVMRASLPPGWIAGIGQTIGNTGSGATLMGADVLALFTLWWTDYSNAQLPILTSAGGASTRGASAAADWSAGKRLTVFDTRDRVARTSGAIQANGTKLEGTRIVMPYTTGATGVIPEASQVVTNADPTAGTSANYGIWATTAQPAVALGTYTTRMASLGMLGCFKL